MKKRKLIKNSLNILEKVIFVVLLLIVVITASGYKYDVQKKELVQTGVLKIENLEDNADLTFNNNVYRGKNNISISLLDQNSYELKINKKDHKDYSTYVNIKPGEVTYVNPVLIPEKTTEVLVRDKVSNTVSNDNSLFYTYEENNLTYIERLSINKNIFNINVNKTRFDITQYISKDKKITLTVGNNDNYIVINTNSKTIIADFNKLQGIDITSLLPQQNIVNLEINNDYLIIKYDNLLYSANISDVQKIQRNLIFTGTNYNYALDENNQILIFYTNSSNQNILEKYSFSGIQQSKSILKSDVTFSPTNQSIDKLIYFYKNIYIVSKNTLYKIVEDQIVEFQKNINFVKLIDRNNMLVITDKSSVIYSRERQLVHDLKTALSSSDILVYADLFTILYLDQDKNVHLADLGGQDNLLIAKSVGKFISGQNGSDTYIMFERNAQILSLQIGNNQ